MSDRQPGIVIRLPDSLGSLLDAHDRLPDLDQVSEDLSALVQLLVAHGARTSRFVPRRAATPEAMRALERSSRRAWQRRLLAEGQSAEIQALEARRIRRVGRSVTQYWFIHPPDPDQVDEILASLSQLPVVEWAARMPGFSDAFTLPTDEHYPDQGYLEPAEKGIGVEAAWNAGYTGSGMRLIDVERAWRFDHDDLPTTADDEPIYGLNKGTRSHGTSVLAIVGGRLGPDRPGLPSLGIVGIAHDVESLLTASRATVDGTWHDVAGAITAAMQHDPRPHVLLLEVQLEFEMATSATDTRTVLRRFPLELLAPYWSLIWDATQLGIVVVEAAGNGTTGSLENPDPLELGGIDLDTEAADPFVTNFITGGTEWNEVGESLMDLNPDASGFLDSDAIMVGAGASETETVEGITGHRAVEATSRASRRSWGSNYGARVDCYAWGEKVVTAKGTGAQEYTWSFDGTSSAAAIIAGTALLVQQMFIDKLGDSAWPSIVRQILSEDDCSTPHVGDRPIGRMPDLERIVERLNREEVTDWAHFGGPDAVIYESPAQGPP